MHGEEKNQQEILTPSFHGELCRHNGENPDYEIACDELLFNMLVLVGSVKMSDRIIREMISSLPSQPDT